MKYEILWDEPQRVDGVTLYRIRALRDIPWHDVKAGDCGGWVAGEHNLSQDGDAWITDNAVVCGRAYVSGRAVIHGNAHVFGEAHVFGSAAIYGHARVSGCTAVFGHAHVFGNAWVA
ncbi:hypothetical protein KEQ40_19695, partial [Escherichia coli]|nr:hypothetical protein [Escherichia coli]